MTESQIREIVEGIYKKLKTHKAVAKYFGVTQGYIADVLKGKRNAGSPSILAKLKIKKVIDYEIIDGKSK